LKKFTHLAETTYEQLKTNIIFMKLLIGLCVSNNADLSKLIIYQNKLQNDILEI